MKLLNRFAALAMALSMAAGALAQPLKPFEPHSLEQIMASHRGKPFLLLVWSMDCEFCQASLEVLSKARAAHPGLEIVTVTTDPVADAVLAGEVGSRLSSLRLHADAWGFGAEAPERLRFAIDPLWRGEKPRSYWYDGNAQRAAFSGSITRDRVEHWLQTSAPRRRH